MATRAAILVLRARLRALRGRLEVLAQAVAEAQEEMGGEEMHCLMEQVDKTAMDSLGWVKGAAAAVRRAAAAEAPAGEVRAALTDAQHELDELRAKEPCRLRGRALRGLLKNLADARDRLPKEREDYPRRVGRWARRAIRQVRSAAAALEAVDDAVADCWRELANAADPAGKRVKVKTITVVE